jgi:hypothetical protein
MLWVQSHFMGPGKPVQNAYIGSFNGWTVAKTGHPFVSGDAGEKLSPSPAVFEDGSAWLAFYRYATMTLGMKPRHPWQSETSAIMILGHATGRTARNIQADAAQN